MFIKVIQQAPRAKKKVIFHGPKFSRAIGTWQHKMQFRLSLISKIINYDAKDIFRLVANILILDNL